MGARFDASAVMGAPHAAILPVTIGVASALAAAAGGYWLSPMGMVASATLAGLMAAVAVNDFQRFSVPDPVLLVTALTGFVWVCGVSRTSDDNLYWVIGTTALQSLLCGGALLVLREGFYRLKGIDGLGFGDVKLAAAAGIWIGWELFTIAVLIASVAALTFVAASAAMNRGWPRNRRIPFAGYLAPTIWACWFAGQS